MSLTQLYNHLDWLMADYYRLSASGLVALAAAVWAAIVLTLSIIYWLTK